MVELARAQPGLLAPFSFHQTRQQFTVDLPPLPLFAPGIKVLTAHANTPTHRPHLEPPLQLYGFVRTPPAAFFLNSATSSPPRSQASSVYARSKAASMLASANNFSSARTRWRSRLSSLISSGFSTRTLLPR